MAKKEPLEFDVGSDFNVTKLAPRQDAGGVWVGGTLNGHRFDALVFEGHADDPEWELNNSRISKLWVQRLADKKVVFDWDRGSYIAAHTDMVQTIVDFLAVGLADYVFAK